MTKEVGISVAADMVSNSVPGGRVKILEELGAKVKAKLEKAIKKNILTEVNARKFSFFAMIFRYTKYILR